MKYITSLSGPCCPGPEYLIDLSKSNVPLTTGGVENAHMKEKIIVIINDPKFVDITTIKTYPDTKITPLGDGKYEIVMPSSDIRIYGVSNGTVPYIPKSQAKFGDIYLTNGKIVSLKTYLINKNKLELEGIVVTSTLSDNKIRIISPNFYEGPFSTLSSFPVSKGRTYDFPGYENLDYDNVYKLTSDPVYITDSDYLYEYPQSELGWKKGSYLIPIPGSSDYYSSRVLDDTTQEEIEIDNILTHIDGEQNCKDILNEQGTIENFPILSAIPEGYYIPSVGELGYIIMNLSKLNDILEELNLKTIENFFSIWTSTIEYNLLLRMNDYDLSLDARTNLNSSFFAIPVKSVEASDPRLIVKYNVEDDTDPTQLYMYSLEGGRTINGATMFDKVEIDDTEVSIADLDTAQGTYQLTAGEHTVKYTLKDPTLIGMEFDGYYRLLRIGALFKQVTAITNVIIPDSVTSIDYDAFNGCTALTTVTIPDSITKIGYSAFYNCSSLISVTIPNNVTSIGERAFFGCASLTNVTIPSSVTKIKSSTFQGCSGLTSITIPNSITSIDGYVFEGCTALTSVTIPDSVTSIGDGAFDSCTSLTSVIVPNSVTSIGNGAFYYCTALTSITIPDSITSIGDNTFGSCSSLTSITIPDSVTSIGNYAFYSCIALASVTIEATTPPTLNLLAFEDVDFDHFSIYVPAQSVESYKTASDWSVYADRIQAIP